MRIPFVALALACLAVAGAARAGDPPPAEGEVSDARREARELAEKGDALFGAGRCDKAILAWQKADARFHAPTIGLRIARCQALVGRVVDATRTLQAIASEKVPDDAPAAFRDAATQAQHELPAIRERVAHLELHLRGEGTASNEGTPFARIPEALVMIDGTLTAARAMEIDPGKHLVQVRAGGASWETTVVLDDGERATVEVSLSVETPAPPKRTQRNAGLVVGGAGLAAMIAGAVLGGVALSTSSSLDASCGADRKACSPADQGKIDRLKNLSLFADLTLVGGLALTSVGGGLVLLEPPPKRETPRVRFVGGLGGAALMGSF